MDALVHILTGRFIPLLLLLSGIYYAAALDFFPLRRAGHIVRTLTRKSSKKGVSPLRSLTLALAGTLGVGNIVGVTSAIALGGVGAVFWMWVSALAVMLLKYAEVCLGVKYRKTADGHRSGGAPYYIKEVLIKRGMPKLGALLACIFALLCLADSLTTGCAIQSSAIAGALEGVIGLPPLLCGLVLAILTSLVLISGRQTLFRATELLVPFMCGGYILLTLVCVLQNPREFLPALGRIISDALAPKSAAGGIFGFLLSKSVRFGTMRGLLSNEAGCGTSPFAHAAAETDSPVEQGFYGIFEVFVDTILLCSMTAVVVVMRIEELDLSLSPIMLAIKAYSGFFDGNAARAVELFLALAVALFGFATFLCWAHYGLECLSYLRAKRPWQILYIIIYAAVIAFSALGTPLAVWNLSDLIIAAMLTLHIPILCLFSHEVKADTKQYFAFSPKRVKMRRKFTNSS